MPILRTGLALALATASFAAAAQGYPPRRVPFDPDATGSLGGRAPWHQPWQYDSGGAFDRHPARPYYQQDGGQQTGGPARNLIPCDGLHITPRC